MLFDLFKYCRKRLHYINQNPDIGGSTRISSKDKIKMLRKVIVLAIVLGVAIAEPVAKLSSPVPDDLDSLPAVSDPIQKLNSVEDTPNQLKRLLPEGSDVILDAVNAVAGYKFTALSLGVLVIEWLISNAVVIFIGAAVAVGFCKITGKCNLNYESYIPVASLKDYVTPEYLETAEKFFVSAMEKYAEKKARAAQNKPWFY